MPTNCPCCKEPTTILAQDTFICDGCKTRTHIACVGLTPEEAARLATAKPKSSAIKTFCTPCTTNVDKFSHLTELITNLQTNLESKVAELVTKIATLQNSTPPTDLKPELYESIVVETMERITRSKNIVIFHAPEAADPSQQKKHDLAVVKEVTDMLEVSDAVSPVSVCRFGRTVSNRPRMLKVVFGSKEEARLILRNKNRITSRSGISIQDDKTKKQLDYLGNVRKELRRRIQEGDCDLTIKYVRCIPIHERLRWAPIQYFTGGGVRCKSLYFDMELNSKFQFNLIIELGYSHIQAYLIYVVLYRVFHLKL